MALKRLEFTTVLDAVSGEHTSAGMAGSIDLDESATFDGLSGGQGGFARASCELTGFIGPLEGAINPTYGVDFADPTLGGAYVTPAELRIPEPTGGLNGNLWQAGGALIVGAGPEVSDTHRSPKITDNFWRKFTNN